MEQLQYKKIAEASSRGEAEVIESFLRAEGIDVVIRHISGSESGYPVALGDFEIYVPEELVLAARKWLENSKSIKEGKE